MMINGKKMTIPWHIKNLKISHVEKKGVPKIIEWLKGIYGSHMKEYQGKKHDYLSMEMYLLLDWRSG